MVMTTLTTKVGTTQSLEGLGRTRRWRMASCSLLEWAICPWTSVQLGASLGTWIKVQQLSQASSLKTADCGTS